MTKPGQADFNFRECRQMKLLMKHGPAGQFVQPDFSFRPMDQQVKARVQDNAITPCKVQLYNSDHAPSLIFSSPELKETHQDVKTDHDGPFREQENWVTTFEEGKFRSWVLWEHLLDKFAQSYNRCDVAAPIQCSELPKGNDRPWISTCLIRVR